MGFNRTEDNFGQDYFNNLLLYIRDQLQPEAFLLQQEINKGQKILSNKINEYYNEQNLKHINKKKDLEKELKKEIDRGKKLRVKGEKLQRVRLSLIEENKELQIASEKLQKDCQDLREGGLVIRRKSENLRKSCENQCDEIIAKHAISFEKLKCQNQIELDEMIKRVDLIINKNNTGPQKYVMKICCFVSDIFSGLANCTSFDFGKNLMYRPCHNVYLERIAVGIVGIMSFIFLRKASNDMSLL